MIKHGLQSGRGCSISSWQDGNHLFDCQLMRAPKNIQHTWSSRFGRPCIRSIAVCFALVMMAVVVFWPCGTFSFVNYDDNAFVYNNNHVLKGLTWQNARWSLTAGLGKEATDADFWRPLSLMSHMLDVSLFGMNAGAHHLISVMVHILTSLALFLGLKSMSGRLWCPAFTAAVFAIHPLHVESVAWVAERKDVLCGLFFVLTIFAYLQYVKRSFRWGWYLLGQVLYAMALMSKPMVVTMPCVLLLLDYWPLGRMRTVPVSRLLVEKAPMFLMAVVVSVFTLSMPIMTSEKEWNMLPWYYHTGNAILSYGIYLRQTFWPTGLACLYRFPGRSLDFWSVGASSAVLLGISALVWWQRKRPGIVVGWLWFLGMLVPVIGLFMQAGEQAHADRYTYLPMTGLSVMIAWPLADWACERRSAYKVMCGGVAAAVLIVLMIMAHGQVLTWKDSRSMWANAVRCVPDNSTAHANLGASLIEAGRTQEAVVCFEKALALNPNQPVARLNLGLILLHAGRLDEAATHLQHAVMVDPKSAEAQRLLGYILLKQDKLEEALEHFQRAVNIRPDAANRLNLGNALLQGGQFLKAIENYLGVIEEEPGNVDALYSLGMIYANLGKSDSATRYYQKALAVNPGHLPSINNLAWILATCRIDHLRDGAKAIKLIELALMLPKAGKAHLMNTLAAAYAETGQYDKALQAAAQAAELARAQRDELLLKKIAMERSVFIAGAPWRE